VPSSPSIILAVYCGILSVGGFFYLMPIILEISRIVPLSFLLVNALIAVARLKRQRWASVAFLIASSAPILLLLFLDWRDVLTEPVGTLVQLLPPWFWLLMAATATGKSWGRIAFLSTMVPMLIAACYNVGRFVLQGLDMDNPEVLLEMASVIFIAGAVPVILAALARRQGEQLPQPGDAS
jgi:hypothetical protein